MTQQEIKTKIAAVEKALGSSAATPEVKATLNKQLDKLKDMLEDASDKPAAEPKKESAPSASASASGGDADAIRGKIAKFEAKLSDPNTPQAALPKIKEQIQKLKDELKDAKPAAEKKTEQKEVKAAAKEAEKKIEAAEKQIASPSTPAKQKAALKKRVQAVKKVVKEAKADAEKQTEARRRGRPRKEVVAKAPAKRGRPAKAAPAAKKTVVKRATKAQVAKPAPKPVVAKKRVVKRATKAAAKVRTAVSSLEKLVQRTKELRAMYAGKGVDLDRDAARGSKRPGWRIPGSNRRATKADIKAGRAYYEARPNHSDIQKSKYPKLAKGGMMDTEELYIEITPLKNGKKDEYMSNTFQIGEDVYASILRTFTKETYKGDSTHEILVYGDDEDRPMYVGQVNKEAVKKVMGVIKEMPNYAPIELRNAKRWYRTLGIRDEAMVWKKNPGLKKNPTDDAIVKAYRKEME